MDRGRRLGGSSPDVEEVDDTEASHLLHRPLVAVVYIDFRLVLARTKDQGCPSLILVT
jgi:hypothetical protein